MPFGRKYVIGEGGEVAARPDANLGPNEKGEDKAREPGVPLADFLPQEPRRRLFGPKHTVESVARGLLSGLESGLISLENKDISSTSQFVQKYIISSPHTSTYQDAFVVASPTWKRVLDTVLVLLSFPFFVPLLILIAIWIKISSPGPIFFLQERVGFRGRRFVILKFRTMKANVETQSHERYLEELIRANRPMTSLDASDDPRIMPGGRFLRATGLDDVPQIINVLRGEMSIVGPRPTTVNEFTRLQPWQRGRVDALPGITGYWQVNGKNKTTYQEMINLDLFYTKNLSIWLDLVIIAKTIPAILAQLIEAYTVRHRPSRPEESSPKSSPDHR